MAEDESPGIKQVAGAMAGDPQPAAPPSYWPDGTFPAVFVDGVLSASRVVGVVKVYFYRMMPDIYALGRDVERPICQLIMPNFGFAQTTHFFMGQVQHILPSLPADIRQVLRAECVKMIQAIDGTP